MPPGYRRAPPEPLFLVVAGPLLLVAFLFSPLILMINAVRVVFTSGKGLAPIRGMAGIAKGWWAEVKECIWPPLPLTWPPRNEVKIGLEELIKRRTGTFAMHTLPLIPLFQILDELKMMDLMDFSRTSPECKDMVREFLKNSKTNSLVIKIADVHRIALMFAKPNRDYSIVNIRCLSLPHVRFSESNDRVVSCVRTSDAFDTYSWDRCKSVIDWIDHLTYILNCRVTSVDVDISAEMVPEVVHILEHLKTPPDWINIANLGFIANTQLAVILDKCQGARKLTMQNVMPRGFAYSGGFAGLKIVSLESGSWLTLDNLLEMDIVIVQMCAPASRITDADLNTYFKKWMAGECHVTLKRLNIEFNENIDETVVFDGIDVTRHPVQRTDTQQVKMHIERASDQMIGTIHHDFKTIHFYVAKKLL